MIVVDANVIIMAVTQADDEQNRPLFDNAQQFFRRAERGEIDVFIPAAVVAEVMFILTSPRKFGLNPSDACELMETLLLTKNIEAEGQPQILKAFSLWSANPGRGFVDALVAAWADAPGNALASVDRHLKRFPTTTNYEW